MAGQLSKCPRCGRLFSKAQKAVCLACLPNEEEDYRRIRDALNTAVQSTPEQLAAAAGVEVDCVNRMLNEGLLARSEPEEAARCGRCGGLAISASKRLCQACLTRLEAECMLGVRSMTDRLQSELRNATMNAREAFNQKRRV